jgi:hypothetical protein
MGVKVPDGALHRRIRETLRQHPRGLTTMQLYQHLGRRSYESISSTTSKLHAYGVIDAERIPHSHGFLWKAK